jgi:RNA polymerase sigma-70 factor (ECF subfamily)
MSETATFLAFLQRVRAGDPDAAADLVRQFEPQLRIEIRRRLNDPYLNRAFDSSDVCQSVLASFFFRACAGQYDLDRPEDLLNLLMSMARKKVASLARKERTQARDNRRVSRDPNALEGVSDGPTPERLVAGKELLEKLWSQLSEEERGLADLRVQGRTWPEIAAAVGGQPQARRRQLERALDRVVQDYGLEDADDV